MPNCTLKKALTSYLDISGQLTQEQIGEFAQFAQSTEEANEIEALAQVPDKYNAWVKKCPNLLDLLEQYPSLDLTPQQLVTLLLPLGPRTYSITSVDPKFMKRGDQNIPVTQLLLSESKFLKGPFGPTVVPARDDSTLLPSTPTPQVI